MSCNCGGQSQCSNCCKGIPCNCPPVYPIPTVPVPCICCPAGYVPNYSSAVANSKLVCINSSGGTTSSIPCVDCVDSVPADCVIYNAKRPIVCGTGPNFTPGTNIYGIVAGDTLTDIISKMCITNPSVIMALLTAIGNNPTLIAGFCNLVQNCGTIPGVTTPIIGPITFTIP